MESVQQILMAKKKKTKPITSDDPQVYSYLRFSTKKQKEGDSTRRQNENIIEPSQKFAEANKMIVNTTVNFADEGLSAFHGAHRKRGKLGMFLAMVEKGQISKGSFLYVEDIDRLTREAMFDALEMILSGLLKNDVGVVTYNEFTNREIVYTRESINNGSINSLIDQIGRAHGESLRKSNIAKSNWKQKRKLVREQGKIVSTRCPAWLTVMKDDTGRKTKFDIIPKAAITVQMIFELKLQGVGSHSIAKRLNQKAPWKTSLNKKGKGGIWSSNYINKILRNRAVMGEFQPCRVIERKQISDGAPLPDYYPQVVSPDIFHAVQKRLKKNLHTGGPTGKCNNLFRGLAFCAYCGGPMYYKNSKRNYLICRNGQHKVKCKLHSIRYDETEKLILENCRGLKPEQILPNANEQAKLCQMLRQRIQGKEAEIEDKQKQIDNFVENLGRTTKASMVERYERSITKLEDEVMQTKMSRERDEMELRHAENDKASFVKWQSNFETLQKVLSKKNDPELRMRLRTHLQELIERIEIFSEGFEKLYDVNKDEPTQWRGKPKPGYADSTETIADYLWDTVYEDKRDKKLAESKLFRNFVNDLVKRRMSKEGRFIRIFFITGAWVDLVPEGSIAEGRLLYYDTDDKKKKWQMVKPDLNKLLKEYKEK